MRSSAIALFILSTCVGAALASGPVAAATTKFGKNLLKNPGAEDGPPGAAVPDWEVDTDFAVITYGGAGAPSKKQSQGIDGGKQLFSTGPYSVNFDACGTGAQFITIKNRDGEIDGGKVQITLEGYLGTKTRADSATVTVQFRDGNNHQVSSKQLTLGPVSTKAKLVADSDSLKVPSGTRILRVQLLGDPVEQTCDAFFDNLSVVLELR